MISASSSTTYWAFYPITRIHRLVLQWTSLSPSSAVSRLRLTYTLSHKLRSGKRLEQSNRVLLRSLVLPSGRHDDERSLKEVDRRSTPIADDLWTGQV